MSTESGNNGSPGTGGPTGGSGSTPGPDGGSGNTPGPDGGSGNTPGPDGGRLRDRSDRLASADDTQVLPAGGGNPETAPPAGATAAGAPSGAPGRTSARAGAGPAGPHDEGGRTRALPLSATKDPGTDYDDGGYHPEAGASRAGSRTDDGTAADAGNGTALPGKANREALLAMEKERFGGMKVGAAFFGWLTATGMVVLLSALAAAIGAAVGFSTDSDLGQSLDQAMANQSAGIIGTVILLVILLLAYYAGGYVAGRMARFNGLKQGLAVWLWALAAGVAVVVLGLIFGDDIRSITQLNTVAPLPGDLDGATAVTWIAVAATLAATLVGALLGGLGGMRYHRRIDRADFSETGARA
ncbi:hypothetical protein OL239_02065 [Arthrobacter sp. ATA002]|uniref:hypothetical protein n=1 Tax=Arthrobacter sp. ATA002 TaxID=2991715 RepID=UPI0022A78083|nr:hypothetical protein [Arthrobacter sp. ATA002]WAP52126.1 hypothetical protein OL239_02065 [Arthrobacter sp. ATA002]